MNLFTNFGDAAIAMGVTLVAVFVCLFDQWVVIALLICLFLLSKGLGKLIPVIAALLLFRVEASTWILIAASLWIGCITNLLWEAGGGQLIAGALSLQRPLPVKAPGILNWIISGISLLILLPFSEVFEAIADWIYFSDPWQIVVVVAVAVAVAVLSLIIYRRHRHPDEEGEGEEEEEEEEDFFNLD